MTAARCPKCLGLNGAHGMIHRRYGNGGGGNYPCPLNPLISDRHPCADLPGQLEGPRLPTTYDPRPEWVQAEPGALHTPPARAGETT